MALLLTDVSCKACSASSTCGSSYHAWLLSADVWTAGAAAGLPQPYPMAMEQKSRRLAEAATCCCQSGLQMHVRVGASSLEAAVQAAALLDQEMMSIIAGQGGCMAAPALAGQPLLCLSERQG